MTHEQTVAEMREHPRHPLPENPNYAIHFRASKDDEFYKAASINISSGGIMISARDPHRPHPRIEIIIFSLNDSEPAILLQGIVCWTGKAPDSGDGDKAYLVGIQFSGTSELQEAALAGFMKTHVLDQ